MHLPDPDPRVSGDRRARRGVGAVPRGDPPARERGGALRGVHGADVEPLVFRALPHVGCGREHLHLEAGAGPRRGDVLRRGPLVDHPPLRVAGELDLHRYGGLGGRVPPGDTHRGRHTRDRDLRVEGPQVTHLRGAVGPDVVEEPEAVGLIGEGGRPEVEDVGVEGLGVAHGRRAVVVERGERLQEGPVGRALGLDPRSPGARRRRPEGVSGRPEAHLLGELAHDLGVADRGRVGPGLGDLDESVLCGVADEAHPGVTGGRVVRLLAHDPEALQR